MSETAAELSCRLNQHGHDAIPPAQLAVLAWIVDWRRRRGHGPLYGELRGCLPAISKAALRCAVDQLLARKLVVRAKNGVAKGELLPACRLSAE